VAKTAGAEPSRSCAESRLNSGANAKHTLRSVASETYIRVCAAYNPPTAASCSPACDGARPVEQELESKRGDYGSAVARLRAAQANVNQGDVDRLTALDERLGHFGHPFAAETAHGGRCRRGSGRGSSIT
jgi:hypothetical protein